MKLGVETKLASMAPQVLVDLLGSAKDQLSEMGFTQLGTRLGRLENLVAESKAISDLHRRTTELLGEVEKARRSSEAMKASAQRIERGLEGLESTLVQSQRSANGNLKVDVASN